MPTNHSRQYNNNDDMARPPRSAVAASTTNTAECPQPSKGNNGSPEAPACEGADCHLFWYTKRKMFFMILNCLELTTERN